MASLFIYSSLISAQVVCEGDLKTFNSLTSFISDLSEASNCSSLDVGEVKLVDSASGDHTTANAMTTNHFGDERYPAPNDSRYLIRRPSENSYEMIFNVNFVPNTTPGSASPEQMLRRARNCMASAAPMLRGPNNEELFITIVSPDMINSEINTATNNNLKRRLQNLTPPQIDINILPRATPQLNSDGSLGAELYRGNANNFTSDFSCAQIVHEMLHHGGLCDEYMETNFSPEFEQAEGLCRTAKDPNSVRALGPTDSFMSSGAQFVYRTYMGRTRNCEIPSTPRGQQMHQFISTYETNPIMNLLMTRNFDDIIIPAQEIGIDDASIRDARTEFCTVGNAEFVPPEVEVDYTKPLTTITAENSSSISFSYYQKLNNFNTSMGIETIRPFRKQASCTCAGVDASKQAACRRYLETIKMEIRPLAEENTHIYQCPFGTRPSPSEDYSREPGSIALSGRNIQFRSKPSPSRPRSILYEAHFLRLVNGECEVQNNMTSSQLNLLRNYNACARFSRKVSRRTLNDQNETSSAVKECNERPSFCYNTREWLGNKQ